MNTCSEPCPVVPDDHRCNQEPDHSGLCRCEHCRLSWRSDDYYVNGVIW